MSRLPAEIVEVDPDNIIIELEKRREKRKQRWGDFFEKYSKADSTESIPIKDCSFYYNDGETSPVPPQHDDDGDIRFYNEGRPLVMNTEDKGSEAHKSDDPTKSRDLFHDEHFLSGWTTPNEIKLVYRYCKQNKIHLRRLVKVIQSRLKSNLKDLLVLREEARILKWRKFDDYDLAAKQEARRLMRIIGKKYLIMYVVLYKCDIPPDELCHMMEKKYKSKLGEFVINVPDSLMKQKSLRKEWKRLKKLVPTEYLVEYYETLQLNWIRAISLNKRQFNKG